MYSVFDIANWFLQQTPCDRKKLQKLCYYAQAWHLALYKTRLFPDGFEAWVHGPVCRALWERTGLFEFENIPADIFSSSAGLTDDSTDQFLTRVFATYGGYSGFDLECLTHTETPWINARKGYSEMERCTVEIADEDMMNYYRQLICGEGIGE